MIWMTKKNRIEFILAWNKVAVVFPTSLVFAKIFILFLYRNMNSNAILLCYTIALEDV